jgi:hypothetical protein
VSDLINSFGYKNNVVVDKSTIFYFTSIWLSSVNSLTSLISIVQYTQHYRK